MSVHDAVIERQCDVAARPHDDLLLIAVLDDHRPLLELADAEDRRLRLIDDDGRGEQAAR